MLAATIPRLMAMVLLLVAPAAMSRGLTEVAGDLSESFRCEVDRRLEIPAEEQLAYAARLRAVLESAEMG